jgi:hypothetical protein
MGLRSKAVLAALVVGVVGAGAACTPPPGSDVTAPTAVSVTATPTNVHPGDPLTLSAHVTDPSGVTYVALKASRNHITLPLCAISATRASGTSADGTWSLTCPVPDVVNSGTYRVDIIALDAKGNALDSGPLPDDRVYAQFNVLGGLSDDAPPAIVSVDATPDPVSVGQPLTLSAHLTDATGVSNVALAVSADGNPMPLCTSQATLASGTTTDGTWSLTCPVPTGTAAGTYRVDVVALDPLGNLLNTYDGPTSPTVETFAVA